MDANMGRSIAVRNSVFLFGPLSVNGDHRHDWRKSASTFAVFARESREMVGIRRFGRYTSWADARGRLKLNDFTVMIHLRDLVVLYTKLAASLDFWLWR